MGLFCVRLRAEGDCPREFREAGQGRNGTNYCCTHTPSLEGQRQGRQQRGRSPAGCRRLGFDVVVQLKGE